MSVIEDTRKLIQDFLAPELRSISVRLDNLEKERFEDKFDLLRAINEGNARLEKQRAEDKSIFLEVLTNDRLHMDRRFNDLIDYNKMMQRVDKLEEDKQAKNQ